MSQYTDMMTCGKRMWSRYVLIHDSTEVTTTFSPLSTCWVSARMCEPLKAKTGTRLRKAIVKIIRDDGRCLKFAYWQRKKFYNSDVQKFLKKHNINHYSTYSVMKANGSTILWRTTCGNNLCTMEITNRSTFCRVSYQITTRANIELSVCVPSMLLPRSPTDS